MDRALQSRYLRSVLLIALPLFLVGAVVTQTANGSGIARRWDFEQGREGQAPDRFTVARTGGGRPGQWIIRAEADAPAEGMC